jgi:acetylornithine deacetylase/succinyl-diaminopimelate desuccinylase-like protein
MVTHMVRANVARGWVGVASVMVCGIALASTARAAGGQGSAAAAGESWPAADGGRLVADILAHSTPADDSLRDETLMRLSEYIRINTSNPPGNELATAHWLKDVLAREGIQGEILDTAELGPGRANFYAVLKGDGSQKGIALVHHMDVVPAPRERWAEDPFAGIVKDGFLWGRGTLDMKGQGIIQLMAMIALKRAGTHLTRDIVFIGNADEEEDGTGAVTFIKRHRDLLQNVEYLITESSDVRVENGRLRWWSVGVGEKRAFWQRLVVHGKASHASYAAPDNPVPRLARAIVRLAAWDTPVRLSPIVDREFKVQALYETGEHREWLSHAASALRTPRGRAWLLSDLDRNALLRNTVAPTMMRGADVTNQVPGEATAQIDIRLLADEDTTAFKRELSRIIDDPKVEVQTLPGLQPRFNSSPDTKLFHTIEHVVHEVVPGVPIATTTDVGATDRPVYADVGIVCYGLTPYFIEMAIDRRGEHGDDERIPVNTLGWGVRFVQRILTEMQ